MLMARAVSEIDPAYLARLLRDPGMLFQGENVRFVKRGRTSLLARCMMEVGGHPVAVAYKRIRRPSQFKIATGLFRESRAKRNWRLGQALLQNGIATPRPLAVIAPRIPGIGRRCYLAVEWLEDAMCGADYLTDLRQQTTHERDEKLNDLADSLGTLLGRMHRCGFRHRDLKVYNLMFRERDGKTESFVIDLDSAGQSPVTSPARRLRDLARLIIDIEHEPILLNTHRLRFLAAYLRELGRELGDSHWTRQELWTDLERASRSLKRRRQRKHQWRACRAAIVPAKRPRAA